MNRKFWVLFLLAGVAGSYVLITHVAAGAKGPSAFAAATAADLTCTTSGSFSGLPGMILTFRTNEPSPAIVLFQSQWANNGGSQARVRIGLLVDTVPLPGFEDTGVWTINLGTLGPPGNLITGTSGFNFVTERLQSGLHTVEVQWRTQFPPQEVCAGRRSLIVLPTRTDD